jgi:anthranilate synthase component II
LILPNDMPELAHHTAGAAIAPIASRRVLVIDNYDSFVYNLVQYIGELGSDPIVYRNDQITLDEITDMAPDLLLLSPGPGRPDDAGILCSVIERFAGQIPMLGVCLGHQAMGHVFGGQVVRAPQLMHGKTSWVRHDGVGVFAGLPTPFEATRYHSLVVDAMSLPTSLEVTATTEDGIIMGMRHRDMAVEGVQFHPESILTSAGKELVANFLRW